MNKKQKMTTKKAAKKDYRAHYKLVEGTCAGCNKTTLLPSRNNYCSRVCYDKHRKVKNTQFEKSLNHKEMPPLDILIRTITDQVYKAVSPYFITKEAHHPVEFVNQEKFKDGFTIILSDLHIPFHHVLGTKAVIQFLRAYRKTGLLKRLILNGDVFDAATLSRHLKRKRSKFNGDLGEEMKTGKDWIMPMVACFEETYMLGGNHEEGRLQRLLANEGVGVPEDPMAFNELLSFYKYSGVKFIARPEIFLGSDDGKVKIFHGEKYNDHTAATILKDNHYTSSVQGHTHRPQTYFSKTKFGAVNGMLLDPDQQDYRYDPPWTLGFTILEHFNNGTEVNPYFVKISFEGEFSFAGKKYDGKTENL
jgi:predicted phosphodiesterase